MFWTPSCSCGNIEVSKGGEAENHAALAKLQWKNKCESFSIILQIVHCLLIFGDRFPALSPVASALLISLQANALCMEEVFCVSMLFLRYSKLGGRCYGRRFG